MTDYTTDYRKFLKENMNIPTTQDKNPMFYIFTAARLGGKKQPEELGDDWALKSIIERVEKLCSEIGSKAVNGIVADFKPISIMVEFGDCKNTNSIKSSIERIFGLFKQRCTAELDKFSDYYKIDKAFDDFLKSDEYKDFLKSL